MDYPAEIATFTVTGKLMYGNPDTADVGIAPDLEPVRGASILFEPEREPAIFDAPVAATVIYQRAVQASTDFNGQITGVFDSSPDVMLPYYPGQTWRVTIQVPDFPTQVFSITGSAGGTVNIASVVPVAPDPGTDIIAWEAVVSEVTAARDAAAASAVAAAASNPGVANGTAQLDGTTKLKSTQVPTWLTPTAIATRTFVVDTEYATLEDALTATSAGGVLEVRGNHSRATAFVINKAITLRFWSSASITTTSATVAAISVTVNNVTLQSPRLIGTGSGTASTGVGISAIGTLAAPIVGLKIQDPTITGFSKYGIALDFNTDFTIDRPVMSSIAYAGIMMQSCSDGTITGGSIRTLTMPTGFTNAYGVAMTRDQTVNTTLAPRSRNITVRGMTIADVPWEGIDTHGGEQITITGNTLYGCMVGIAVVPSALSGVNTYAPLAITVTNNIIDAQVSGGTKSNGIQFVGVGTVVATATEYATGIVAGNTIIDHGTDSATQTSAFGAIRLEYTKGLIVANNNIIRPAPCGVQVNNTNFGLVLANNTIEDAWSNLYVFAASVYLRSTYNTVTVMGTQITRGNKTATYVNDRGLQVASASNNTVGDSGGNTWANATTPSSGAALVLVSATNGAVPVVRAAAITAPTAPSATYVQAEAAAMKTAVDALRTAIKNYGITS